MIITNRHSSLYALLAVFLLFDVVFGFGVQEEKVNSSL